MSDAPQQLYTNASATAIITPPAIPLHKTDILWVRADRIEELEAVIDHQHKRAEALAEGWRIADDDRIKLEAKLAKAVAEAEKYQRAFAAQSRKLQAVLHIEGVRTTLAELTGGKDE